MQKKIAVIVFGMLLTGTAMAHGPWHASEANTRGWQLMTPEERIEHQSRIRGFTSYEECRTYQASHHQLMEERARQRGMALPAGGRDACEHLKPGRNSR